MKYINITGHQNLLIYIFCEYQKDIDCDGIQSHVFALPVVTYIVHIKILIVI